MTKKLEELFNLPSANIRTETEEDAAPPEDIEGAKTSLRELDEAIDKIDAALPTVRDLEASDREMDDLAKLATEKFQDLMDLGMSVDSRFSGTIFQTAGTLLGHAITAKQAKLDKKLRMVDLQLKKAALDLRAAKALAEEKPGEGAIEGEGTVLDRNAVIQAVLNRNKSDNK